MKIAVLVTCYNRVEVTLRGIKSLVDSLRMCSGVDYHIFLVDDGSSDDTGSRVEREFPFIKVYRGPGSLFWAGGMRRAFQAAAAYGPFDAYLLFNDDVNLFHAEVENFFDTYRDLNSSRPHILVGACVDSENNLTYSGFNVGSKWKVLDFHHVPPAATPTVCDTFNANFVLIPGAFLERIDGLDPVYGHSYADIDLGLVARGIGIQSVVHTDPIGICEKGTPLDARIRSAGFKNRWRLLFMHPHGLTPYFHFAWKHRPRWMFPLIATLQLSKRLRLAVCPHP